MRKSSKFTTFINEGFYIENNVLFFDPEVDDYIKTGFGKFSGNKPYSAKLPFGNFYAPYTRNKSSDSKVYDAILNAIKGKGSLRMDPESYQKFLNRTAIYLKRLFMDASVDVILSMASSSKLNNDILNLVIPKLPSHVSIKRYDTAIFKNPDLDNIWIDKEAFNLDERTVGNIQRTLDKMKERGQFKISDMHPKFRAAFRDWLKMENHVLHKIINQNVVVFDDYYTSGVSIKEASRLIQDAGAKSFTGIGIIKGN